MNQTLFVNELPRRFIAGADAIANVQLHHQQVGGFSDGDLKGKRSIG